MMLKEVSTYVPSFECEADDDRTGKILVIVTGGTICMTHTGDAASLRPTSLSDRLRQLPEMKDPSLPQFDVLEWASLVDSSDINVIHWATIGENVAASYGDYDGFVVLHGTDTLAYTASALSFMLENLGKPVVLTGSMLPLCHIQSDARRNLTVAMLIAGFSHITEVVVLFGSRLMRGNRTVKLDCDQMEAFDSPKFTSLGHVGVEVTIDEQLLLMPSKRSFRLYRHLLTNHVIVVQLTPGFPADLLYQVMSSPLRPLGVILLLFGSGTAPCGDPRFTSVISQGIASGVEVVAVTQCTKGTCSLLTYENGVKLYQAGVIEGKDLTPEAAFCKMAYLLGKGYKGAALRTMMESPLRGEMTTKRTKVTGQYHADHPQLEAIGSVVSKESNSPCVETIVPNSPSRGSATTPLPYTEAAAAITLLLDGPHSVFDSASEAVVPETRTSTSVVLEMKCLGSAESVDLLGGFDSPTEVNHQPLQNIVAEDKTGFQLQYSSVVAGEIPLKLYDTLEGKSTPVVDKDNSTLMDAMLLTSASVDTAPSVENFHEC